MQCWAVGVKHSEWEVELVTGCAEDREGEDRLLAGGWNLLLSKGGANGQAVYTKKAEAFADTLSVPVTDTTGAGDSFIGSFLYQLTRDGVDADGLSALSQSQLAQYLRFSAQYASLTVQHKGAVMATLDQLKQAYPECTE